MPASAVTAGLLDGQLRVAFDDTVPSGVYEIELRLTRPDGSVFESRLTVIAAAGDQP